jgi:hypothetical protein
MAEESQASEWLKDFNEQKKSEATGEQPSSKPAEPPPPEPAPEPVPAEGVEGLAIKKLSEEDIAKYKDPEPAEPAEPSSDDWKALKQSHQERVGLLEENVAKLQREKEQLMATVSEADKRLMDTDIQQSLTFRRSFQDPSVALVESAAALDASRSEEIVALITAPIEQTVYDEIDSLPEDIKYSVGDARKRYLDLQIQAADFVQQKKEQIDQFKAEDAQRQKEEANKMAYQRAEEFRAIGRAVEKERPWGVFLEGSEGDKYRKVAEKFMHESDPAVIAEALHVLAIAPALFQQAAEFANSHEKLKDLEGFERRVEGMRTSASTNSPPPKAQNETADQREARVKAGLSATAGKLFTQ